MAGCHSFEHLGVVGLRRVAFVVISGRHFWNIGIKFFEGVHRVGWAGSKN
jgi:hypothetical protein